MSVDDLSPSLSISSEKNGVYLPEDFKETPLQNVGGLQAGSRELTHGKIRIAGVDERIYFGEAISFSEGKGIIMGKRTEDKNDYYDFRFGDPEGSYVWWNEETGNLTIKGTITATTGSDVDWSYIENVAIVNADIEDATIEAAKIASLDADDISSGTVSVSYTEADVTQDELDAGASIDDAKAYGETFIQGGYIRTGIIDADRIDTGILNAEHVNIGSSTDFDSGYDPTDKLDENEVGDLVDYDLVEDAMEDESIISGGYIATSYLTADNIAVGELKGIDVISTDGGSDRIELSSGDELLFYAGGSLKSSLRGSTTGDGGLFIENNSDVYIENDHSYFIQDSDGTDTGYGGMAINDSDQLALIMGTANEFYMYDNDGFSGGNRLMTVDEEGNLFAKRSLRISYGIDAYITQYDSSGNANIRFRFNADGGDIECGRTFTPTKDNDYDLGSSSNRWANVYAADTTFGDIGFSNDWSFTEAYKLDIIKQGMALVDENNELRYFFGKDKLYTPENIDELEYNKKTREERRKIENKKVKNKKEEVK
ncbi:MAG: hypothetical protein ACLFVB_09865 [Thermoplasmata archaeon]